jgi:myosin-5
VSLFVCFYFLPLTSLLSIHSVPSGQEETDEIKCRSFDVSSYSSSFENHAFVNDNLINLPHLNEPELLHFLQSRFEESVIYTLTGPVLIAINPSDTSTASRSQLSGNQLFESFITNIKLNTPDTVAGTADTVHHSILIGGESGSGKTECAKKIIQFLTRNNFSSTIELLSSPQQRRKSRSPSIRIEENSILNNVLFASTIFKSFGNATTLHSLNSSRFGQFINMYFDTSSSAHLSVSSPLPPAASPTSPFSPIRYRTDPSSSSEFGGVVIHATMQTYLLENIRVVSQLAGERNFHIFYQLLSGSSEEEKKHLKLSENITFRYLSPALQLQQQRSLLRNSMKSTFQKEEMEETGISSSSFSSLLSDQSEFSLLKDHMKIVGFNQDDINNLFETIAGILHLGQIQFQAIAATSSEGSAIVEGEEQMVDGESYVEIVSRLCGLSLIDVKQTLLEKVIVSRTETVKMQLNVSQAIHARDAIAKAMYLRVFDYLTQEINRFLTETATQALVTATVTATASGGKDKRRKSLRASFTGLQLEQSLSSLSTLPSDNLFSSYSSIGILDIYGFDSFEDKNSFEQLLINYANEALQQQFNQQMFKFQLEEYATEQIIYENVLFVDNQDTLELISNGIFKVLDDQCKLPNPTDQKLMGSLYKEYSNHSRFQANLTQKASFSFVIDHYAGEVTYRSDGFIEKNIDELPVSAINLLNNSKNKIFTSYLPTSSSSSVAAPVTASLSASVSASSSSGFNASEKKEDATGNRLSTSSIHSRSSSRPSSQHISSSMSTRSTTSRNAPSAVMQFKSGLQSLIQQVSETIPHYIRCINPISRTELREQLEKKQSNNTTSSVSESMVSSFNQYHVAEQLRYGGILEAIRVARSGYPIRYSHSDFLLRYRLFLFGNGKQQTSEQYRLLESIPKIRDKKQADGLTADQRLELKEICHSFLTYLVSRESPVSVYLVTSSSLSSEDVSTVTVNGNENNQNGFNIENIQIGLTKIFLKSFENELFENIRSLLLQKAIKILLRFLFHFYQKRKEAIQRHITEQLLYQQEISSRIIQQGIRNFLIQKRQRFLKNEQLYHSVSYDENENMINSLSKSKSIDVEELLISSYQQEGINTEGEEGISSSSSSIPEYIIEMGNKARQARLSKQLGNKISEYRKEDETLLTAITKLLESKKKVDEDTILRFDISLAKKNIIEWIQALPSSSAASSSSSSLSAASRFSPRDSPRGSGSGSGGRSSSPSSPHYSSTYPSSSSSSTANKAATLKQKLTELSKVIDFGYLLILPEKLFPSTLLKKAFSSFSGRSHNTSSFLDSKVSLVKTANKIITKDHKMFKSFYKIMELLVDIIDSLILERNECEIRFSLMQDSLWLLEEQQQIESENYDNGNGITKKSGLSSSASSSSLLAASFFPASSPFASSSTSSLQQELTTLSSLLSTISSLLEVCKLLYQYYLHYISHTITEFGEHSIFKKSFGNDENTYLLTLSAMLEKKSPFLFAEKNNELLKDERFPISFSISSLHSLSSTPYQQPSPYEQEKEAVAKLITASPGLEYLVNCLFQLLKGELLMYPIKFLKIIGKSSFNYGQIAYYHSSLRFTEETLYSSVKSVKQLHNVDSYSYSVAFLTTLLVGITRMKPENVMTKTIKVEGESSSSTAEKKGNSEKIIITGFNNDEQLSSQIFPFKETKVFTSSSASNTSSPLSKPSSKPSSSTVTGGSAYHVLCLLPQFHQPLNTSFVSSFLSNSANCEEIISSLLREIYLQNKRYEALLTAGFTMKDLLFLNLPIELSKLSAIKLYKKMNVLMNAIKENPTTITPYDLLILLYPSFKPIYSQTSVSSATVTSLANAFHRSGDVWYDFTSPASNTTTGEKKNLTSSLSPSLPSQDNLLLNPESTVSFYYKSGNTNSNRNSNNSNNNSSTETTSFSPSSSFYSKNQPEQSSHSQVNNGGFSEGKSTIEEISSEFLKCIDFKTILKGRQSLSHNLNDHYEENPVELYAAGQISDNFSFLSTLFLRHINEEQLIIMFGGLIENCYRALYLSPSSSASSSSVVSQPPSLLKPVSSFSLSSTLPPLPTAMNRSATVSSKFTLKSVILMESNASLRKILKASIVIQALESILNVRVAFGEQDVSHYHLDSNQAIEDEEEEGEEGNDEDEDYGELEKLEGQEGEGEEEISGKVFEDLRDKIDFLKEFEENPEISTILLKSIQRMRNLLIKFIINYPKEATVAAAATDTSLGRNPKTENEIEDDIELVLDVVSLSYQAEIDDSVSFQDTIPSLQLQDFLNLLLSFHSLLYDIAIDFAERNVFNYSNHSLQYLLIQNSLEKWETLIIKIIEKQPLLLFIRNIVDLYLPCDRLRQQITHLSSSSASSSSVAVHYRLITTMCNVTYSLYAIHPFLFNDQFYNQIESYFQPTKGGTIPVFTIATTDSMISSPGSSSISSWKEEHEISIEKLMTHYYGEEELLFMAIRYGFFVTIEEIKEKKYNYEKVITMNQSSLEDGGFSSSSSSVPSSSGKNKKEDLQYNIIQACLYLAKRHSEVSSSIQNENKITMNVLLKSIEKRINDKLLSKEQLYDLIYTNGQGKVIINHKNSVVNTSSAYNDFLKHLTAYLT